MVRHYATSSCLASEKSRKRALKTLFQFSKNVFLTSRLQHERSILSAWVWFINSWRRSSIYPPLLLHRSITVMHTTILSAFNTVCHSGFCWVITEKVLFVIVCVHAVGELRKHPPICHSPCLQMCATLLCSLGMSAAFMSFILQRWHMCCPWYTWNCLGCQTCMHVRTGEGLTACRSIFLVCFSCRTWLFDVLYFQLFIFPFLFPFSLVHTLWVFLL